MADTEKVRLFEHNFYNHQTQLIKEVNIGDGRDVIAVGFDPQY